MTGQELSRYETIAETHAKKWNPRRRTGRTPARGQRSRVIRMQVLPLSCPHSNRCVSYLAIERLRQSDDTGARIDNEMVRELYAIFHRRSFRIVALQNKHFRPDLGGFRERQARRVSPGLQDGRLVHVVTRWNSKKETLFWRLRCWLYRSRAPTKSLPRVYFSRFIYFSR